MTHQSYYIQLEIRESKRSAVTISQCGSRRNHALNGQCQHIRSLLILKWNIWWICQSLVKHKSLTLYGLLLVWKAAYDDQSEERVPTLHCQLSASWDDIPEGSGLGQFYSPPPNPNLQHTQPNLARYIYWKWRELSRVLQMFSYQVLTPQPRQIKICASRETVGPAGLEVTAHVQTIFWWNLEIWAFTGSCVQKRSSQTIFIALFFFPLSILLNHTVIIKLRACVIIFQILQQV